jgi:hypothetical protein
MKTQAIKRDLPALLLRLGLASVFLYAAVATLQQPLVWVGYLPHFLAESTNALTFVKIVAVYELVLVAWLLSGKYVKYAGLLCALTLVGIVLSNTGQLLVTFRDFGLIFAALALMFLDKK